jgi:hypothetical protein
MHIFIFVGEDFLGVIDLLASSILQLLISLPLDCELVTALSDTLVSLSVNNKDSGGSLMLNHLIAQPAIGNISISVYYLMFIY